MFKQGTVPFFGGQKLNVTSVIHYSLPTLETSNRHMVEDIKNLFNWIQNPLSSRINIICLIAAKCLLQYLNIIVPIKTYGKRESVADFFGSSQEKTVSLEYCFSLIFKLNLVLSCRKGTVLLHLSVLCTCLCIFSSKLHLQKMIKSSANPIFRGGLGLTENPNYHYSYELIIGLDDRWIFVMRCYPLWMSFDVYWQPLLLEWP